MKRTIAFLMLAMASPASADNFGPEVYPHLRAACPGPDVIKEMLAEFLESGRDYPVPFVSVQMYYIDRALKAGRIKLEVRNSDSFTFSRLRFDPEGTPVIEFNLESTCVYLAMVEELLEENAPEDVKPAKVDWFAMEVIRPWLRLRFGSAPNENLSGEDKAERESGVWFALLKEVFLQSRYHDRFIHDELWWKELTRAFDCYLAGRGDRDSRPWRSFVRWTVRGDPSGLAGCKWRAADSDLAQSGSDP